MKRAAAGLAIAGPRLRDGMLAVDIGPGTDGGIALRDAGKAILDQSLRGRGSRFEQFCRVERGQLIQSGWS
jgi:hypothetical protein